MTNATRPRRPKRHPAIRLPRHISLALAILCALNPGSPGLAASVRAQVSQDSVVTTLRESPDCDCRIALTKVISLSDSLHPGLFAYSPLVMRDSRGFWYATSNTDGLKQVGVFDQDGRLTKVIGGLGEGPGEFKFINHIVVGSGDSLYVYDHAQLRRSVFDPDHEFVRTDPIHAFMRQIVPLSSGHMIVSSAVMASDRAGWPLHHIGADGSVLQTFGADAMLEHSGIAMGGDGVLWVAPRNAYELANYSAVGPKFEPTNRVYRRQAEWFQPWTERSPDGRPRPSISRSRSARKTRRCCGWR